MSEDLFNTVARKVDSWWPEKRYRSEAGYRDDLLEFLRKRLRVKVVPEAGRHLCDIGVGEEVGIELKRNLHSTSQVDRLRGQLERFLRSYSSLIVVLVGKTDPSKYEELRSLVNEMSSSALTSHPRRIIVLRKGKRKVKKRRRKRPRKGRKEMGIERYRAFSVGDLLGGRKK